MHRTIIFFLLLTVCFLEATCQTQPANCPPKTFRFVNFDFKYPIKVGEAVQRNHLKFYDNGRFGYRESDPAEPRKFVNALNLSHNRVNKTFEPIPGEKAQDYYEEWATDWELLLPSQYYSYDSLFTAVKQQFGPFKPIPAWDLTHSVVLANMAPNGVVVYLARVDDCLAITFYNITHLSPQDPKRNNNTTVHFWFSLTDEEIIAKYNTHIEEDFK